MSAMPTPQPQPQTPPPPDEAQAVANGPQIAQPASVSNTPSTPDATQSAANPSAPPMPAPPTPQQGTQQQTATTPQPAQQNGMVSNAPVPASVHRAGTLRQVAQALAGGPRYQTTIDPNSGATVRTELPLSGRQIGLAIALEALSGGLTGLGAHGPNATGEAAAMGVQQGMKIEQQRQKVQQQQDQAAQNQFSNRNKALIAHAQAFEANSRTILNTAQSERLGVESLKDAVQQNAQVLSDYEDANAVQDAHVTQDDLNAGLTSGKYSPTAQIAIPDGWTSVNGKFEQTFSVVANPNAKVPLTSEQAKEFADAGIPGFAAFKTGNIPTGVLVPGTTVANANAKLHAINMMKQDFSSVSDTLSKSGDKGNQELAKSIPNIQTLLADKNNGPVLQSALWKFQKYVSHSNQHGMDLYESLQQMGEPSKPDPLHPGKFIPNMDVGAANTIASAFGGGNAQRGWAILRQYHDELTPEPIKNQADAQSMLVNNPPGSKAYRVASQWLATNDQQRQLQDDESARAKARYKAAGKAGNAADSPEQIAEIGEELARGAITEDEIPNFSHGDTKVQVQAYLAQHHPNLDQSSIFLDGTERKQRDLGINAIENLNTIQSVLQRRPDLLGVIEGRVSSGKALTGTNDKDLAAVNQALDNWALASTGAHGIRSVEARTDAKRDLLNSFKNGPDAVNAAINTSRASLQQFARLGKPKGLDGSAYVYKTQSSGSGSNSNGSQSQHIPPPPRITPNQRTHPRQSTHPNQARQCPHAIRFSVRHCPFFGTAHPTP